MVQLWRQARYEVSLPKGFTGVCNVGLDFDLWDDAGRTFLDHVREHAPGVALAIWPGEQRQLDRWLSIGLIDVAFCYSPQSGGNFATRTLFDDELILVSDQPLRCAGTSAPPMSMSIMAMSFAGSMLRLFRATRLRRFDHRLVAMGNRPSPALRRHGLHSDAPCARP